MDPSQPQTQPDIQQGLKRANRPAPPDPQQSYTPEAQRSDSNPTLSVQQPSYGGKVDRVSPLGGGVPVLHPIPDNQPSGLKGVKRAGI